jgi:pilus biogenesis lipoprotein CpaD
MYNRKELRMIYSKCLLIAAAAVSLSACEPQFDMQGVDPKDYYSAHPINNQVITRTESHYMSSASLAPKSTMLSGLTVEELHSTLHHVSPPAVEAVNIYLPQNDLHNQKLKDAFVRELVRMGYEGHTVAFYPLTVSDNDRIRIEISDLIVLPPDCPDWRTSPVTTYSNTWQGNFKCSQVVNLGKMVADPHDLMQGTGDVAPDALRDSAVLHDYRNENSASHPNSPSNSGYTVNTNTSPSSGSPATGGLPAPSF